MIQLGRHEVHHGDCVAWMNGLPEDSVDAVVCDPPYGLVFMGKEFDALGEGRAMQAWHASWLVAALRVLKPGGHLVAFSHGRTFHRLWCAAEDVGLEIRDTLFWCQGQGFPKSQDTSKAIDKAAGAERRIVGPPTRHAGQSYKWADTNNHPTHSEDKAARTAPATTLAKLYDGYGTALKPSYEPILLARKPLSGSMVKNVQAHGTGPLDLNGCRIATEEALKGPTVRCDIRGGNFGNGHKAAEDVPAFQQSSLGRWPTNLLMDETMASMLDDESDAKPSRFFPVLPVDDPDLPNLFYTGKIVNAERAGTSHPTPKPLAVMRWLVRLVSPPDRDGVPALVVDPFLGSGTTLIACEAEGKRCAGAEQDDAYIGMIRARYAAREAIVASCDARTKRKTK